MKRTILIFGALAAIIYLLFELNKLSLWGFEDFSELFLIFSGLIFIGIGFLLNRFLFRPKRKMQSGGPRPSVLTKQEHRVLLLMTDGLSNQEIADRLFIAESTVKSHVSNILSKFCAKRRTEAIKIGRDLNIV